MGTTGQEYDGGAAKRRKVAREGGALLSWHAVPVRPELRPRREHQQLPPPSCTDAGRHHVAIREAASVAHVEALLAMQRDYPPDRLVGATAEWVGPHKKIWSAWPHALGSNINSSKAGYARRVVGDVLDKMYRNNILCPACHGEVIGHTVHEVTIMEYIGAGAACKVHKDSALPGLMVPRHRQGAVLLMLRQDCQGGVLHVAHRHCGSIVTDWKGRPKDMGRDAVGLVLHPGDAAMIANVDHCVSRIASGSRALLAARVSCPAEEPARKRARNRS